MFRTIKVYGKLQKHLGKRDFHALVKTPAEAIRFLLANFPTLRPVLEEGKYRISVGETKLPLAKKPECLHYPCADIESIRIIPVISGAGGDGLGKVLAGITIIGFSLLVPAASIGLTGAQMTSVGLFGGALLLGGISQMLTPLPKVPEIESDPRSNYNFSNMQNISRMVPVPIIYGEVMTGSVVVSTSLNVHDINEQ